MSNILEIKPLIRTFIVNNLDERFNNNVYWNGERYKIPQTPYCVLSVIAENKDKRTSTHNGAETSEGTGREVITTLYKIATITLSIYNDAIGDNYDVEKEYAYSQINLLEKLFERKSTHEYFYSTFSVQNTSPIRNLSKTTDGGYQYRFEFDLTIGFNETDSEEFDVGNSVDIDITNKETNDEFNILVTVNDIEQSVNVNIE